MKLRSTLILLHLAALGAIVGCDRSAAEAARSRSELAAAVALVEEAEQGYAGEGSESATPDAFRRDKLAEAATALSTIADNASSPAQAGARRLLAQVHLSTARAKARDATSRFTLLRARTTGLTNYLSAVGRVDRLIQMRATDTAPTIQDIEAASRGLDEDQSRYTAKMAELSLQREQAADRAAQANTEAQRKFAQAQQVRQQDDAAADDPQRQRSLIAEAYQAQRAGEADLNRAQLAEIEVESIDAKLVPLKTELELYKQMSTQLASLQQRVREQGSAADSDVNAARTLKSDAVTEVNDQYQRLADAYQREVAEVLEAAADDAQRAVTLLQAAMQSAKGRDAKAAMEFDLLAARVEQASILTLHARYASTFSRIASTLADSPALAGTGSAAYTDDPARLVQRSKELTESAIAAIDAGNILVDDATENPVMVQALQTYKAQLNPPVAQNERQ